MSLGDYTPQSSFWSTIKRTIGTQLLTSSILYDLGILKLADRTQWLLEEIVRKTASLARTMAGTKAVLTGSVDLSTLTYDPTAGTLNGRTLAIESDTSGVVTVTFGTGTGAPTGPGDVVTAINNENASDPLASVDAAGKLVLSSATSGGLGTITVNSGSAVTAVGFTNGATATGVSSGGDGLNLVGGAQVVGNGLTLPAGTLRSMLIYIADNVRSGAATIAVHATPGATLAINPNTADEHFVQEPSVDCVATIADGTKAGQRVRIVGLTAFASYKIDLKDSAAVLFGTIEDGVTRTAIEATWTGATWKASMWTKDANNI